MARARRLTLLSTLTFETRSPTNYEELDNLFWGDAPDLILDPPRLQTTPIGSRDSAGAAVSAYKRSHKTSNEEGPRANVP